MKVTKIQNSCPKCGKPYIKKEILQWSTHSWVEYTHPSDIIIGGFALVETCLGFFPTDQELKDTPTTSMNPEPCQICGGTGISKHNFNLAGAPTHPHPCGFCAGTGEE